LLPVFKKEVLFPFSQRGIFVKSLVQGFFTDGFKKIPGNTRADIFIITRKRACVRAKKHTREYATLMR